MIDFKRLHRLGGKIGIRKKYASRNIHTTFAWSEAILWLTSRTRREDKIFRPVSVGYVWVFFPSFPLAHMRHEKCQQTRGDRINTENDVEHEQTNHVSSAHMCCKQHAYVATVATTRTAIVVNVFVFLIWIFVLPRIVELPNVGSKQASGLNEKNSSESCSHEYGLQARS